MANPSTTGTGTEVLRRFVYDATGETKRSILTVPADHIYTVKSIFILQRTAVADTLLYIAVDYEGDGNDIVMIEDYNIGQKETFVLNDIFVLAAEDILNLQVTSTAGTATADIYGTFIDQDFS